jgi:hypothetical protein
MLNLAVRKETARLEKVNIFVDPSGKLRNLAP